MIGVDGNSDVSARALANVRTNIVVEAGERKRNSMAIRSSKTRQEVLSLARAIPNA